MNNQQERPKIYLAALLHDVGKFYERTGLKDYKKDEFYNYSHAVYTRAFVDDYPEIKNILNKFELKNVQGDKNLINLAAKHHKPNSDAEWLIHWADRFSAATDRFNNPNNIAKGKSVRPLLSIFSRIDISQKGEKTTPKEADWRFYDVGKLSLKEDFSPQPDALNSIEKYQNLWSDFLEEFKEIGKTNEIEFFTENLLKLLEKFTARMPSSAKNDEIPDVTLFDHSKTTAGFAVAMYNYLIENGQDLDFTKNTNIINTFTDTNKKPFILIGGDLSGIQNFIYDITGQNAAKNLKGRSFYLHILTKAYIRLILRELSLKKANIIYGTGGTFYLIAQNTEKAKKSLDDLNVLINKALYQIFGMKIYFSINYIEFGKKVIDDKKIGCIWDELISKKIEAKKSKKYFDFLDELLIVENIKSNEKDKITGDLIKDYDTGKTEDGKTVKKITADLIKLGRKLRDMDYWVISDTPIDKFNNKKYLFNPFANKYFMKSVEYDEYEQLQVYNYFLPEKELKSIIDAEIIKFNDTNFILKNNYDNILSFEFYGGNKFPVYTEEEINKAKRIYADYKDKKRTKDKEVEWAERIRKKEKDDVKEFTDLAQGENFDRLGILRMDVDSLGTIFAKGFDFSEEDICAETNKKQSDEVINKNEITFSRLATLSRSLDFFFSGYLNKIWLKEKYKDQTMIIYSGGDDLFIVGRWDLLADMAFDIRKDFAEYTGYNPNLTISGGMAIVRDKFPILKAAKLSGEYESKAKNHKIKFYKNNSQAISFMNKKYYTDQPKVVEKNAFAFLGEVFNWDIEFEVLQDLQEEIYKYLTFSKEDKNNLPQGFIQTMINLNNYRKDKENEFGQQDWIWKALYYLKRLKMRNLKLVDFVDATADNIHKYNNEYSNRRPELREFYDDLSVKLLKGKEYSVPKYIDENLFADDVVHFMDLMSVAARWAYLKKKTNF